MLYPHLDKISSKKPNLLFKKHSNVLEGSIGLALNVLSSYKSTRNWSDRLPELTEVGCGEEYWKNITDPQFLKKMFLK